MTAGTALRIVQHAELVKVGKKAVSIQGFRHDLLVEHLRWHLTQMSNKWCSVDCMARTMFGRASEQNRKGVRNRVRGAFSYLLTKYGYFMVIEYDDTPSGRGRIKAMKLFEAVNGAEGQYACHQISRMSRRAKMSAEVERMAREAIGLTDEEAA